MSKGQYSEEEATKLVELFEQGLTAQEIADEIGRSRMSVIGALNYRGCYFKGKHKKLSEEQFAQAKKMLEKHYSVNFIADKFDISKDVLRKILKSQGYAVNMGKWCWNDDRVKLLEHLILQGKTQEIIAREMNISVSSIRQSCYSNYGTYSLKKIRKMLQEEKGKC